MKYTTSQKLKSTAHCSHFRDGLAHPRHWLYFNFTVLFQLLTFQTFLQKSNTVLLDADAVLLLPKLYYIKDLHDHYNS